MRKPRYAAASRRRVRAGVGRGTRATLVAMSAVEPINRPAVPMIARTAVRPRPIMQIFSGVAFVIVLALTLGFSWRDGTADGDGMNAEAPSPAYDATGYLTGRDLRSRMLFTVSATSEMGAPQAPIPTARPVQLLIPALDVHRAVEGIGVNRAGVLDLPVNAWDAGWYMAGPVPGAPGDAVIEGHAGYPGKPMIFGRLVMLKPGDRIIVVLADGTRQLFLVSSIATIPVGSAPPGMAEPYGLPRLTLITCTGHFDQSSYSYSRRLVVEASYAGLA